METEQANKLLHSRLQKTLMSKASMSLKSEGGGGVAAVVPEIFLNVSDFPGEEGVALVKARSCSIFLRCEIVNSYVWMCSGHP